MNGELDFSASLKARVGLLKGVPADVFEKLKSIITISPGALELCKALKALGYRLAVISGGFQPLAEWLAGELGLDYAFANHVCILFSYLPSSFPNSMESRDHLRGVSCFSGTCIIASRGAAVI
jgi:phosphoglycolate phosphatase-like HAD superfamily hydrolase